MQKHSLFLFLLLTLSIGLQAQKPETVYRITEVKQSNEWYKEQIQAWRKVIDQEPQNATAWLNLYKATRYDEFPAFRSDSAHIERINALVDEMEQAIPNSFEFNWLKSWNGNNDPKYWPYMEKAYEIDPNRPEIYEDMLTHYLLEGDWDKVNLFARKWYDSQIMAPSLLWIGYNMMQSADPNGIYFTSGDNDTYPLIVLQHGKNVREDLAVINIHLMMVEDYAQQLFDSKGVKYDEEELKNMTGSNKWPDKIIRFVEHIAEQNPNRKVYFSPSMQKKIMDEMNDDLWCVGLAYQYCKQKIDKPALIRRNLERMNLGHLEMSFYTEDYIYEQGGAAWMNMLYFEPFAQLYEHYLLAGNEYEAAKYRSKSLKLAEAAGMEEPVIELLDSLQNKVNGPMNSDNNKGQRENEK